MSLAESFLSEFDAEMNNTRRILERVPAEKWDWKPHAKSRSLGSAYTVLAAPDCPARTEAS